MKTSFFSLPREIRQQILFASFALADRDDHHAFINLCEKHFPAHYMRINLYHHLQARKSETIKDPGWYQCEPLHYTPSAEKLVSSLFRVASDLREDLSFVVNKWADSKKRWNAYLAAIAAMQKDAPDTLLLKLAIGITIEATVDNVLAKLKAEAPPLYSSVTEKGLLSDVGQQLVYICCGKINLLRPKNTFAAEMEYLDVGTEMIWKDYLQTQRLKEI